MVSRPQSVNQGYPAITVQAVSPCAFRTASSRGRACGLMMN